jgi:hypothetical protein
MHLINAGSMEHIKMYCVFLKKKKIAYHRVRVGLSKPNCRSIVIYWVDSEDIFRPCLAIFRSKAGLQITRRKRIHTHE